MKVRAGTGLSTAADPQIAGREAAEMAVAALQAEAPAVVVVFTSPRYDLPTLLNAIRSVTGEAILIGCTSSGEMVQGQYLGLGAGVAILAMTAGPYRFGVAAAGHIRGNLDQAGQIIARESRRAAGDSPHGAFFLLADSLLGDLQQLVQGIYRITGPKVALFGGGAGDEQKFIRTWVFKEDEVIEEGAVGLWIASPYPLQVITRHGWKPMGVPLLVTRAEGTEMIEIGGQPAAVAYEDQLGLQPGLLTTENFWNTSIRHPFGLIQPDGSTVIRMARTKTPQGTLLIQGCVPPTGSGVQVMTGNADSLMSIAEEVATLALEAHPEPGVLLAFSCAARTIILGPRTEEESQRLQTTAGDIPTFGFYCCAEFARTSGVLGTHNANPHRPGSLAVIDNKQGIRHDDR